MKMKFKRFFSMFLALVMVLSLITITPDATPAATSNPVDCETLDYGLQNDVQDGLILHCWDWSFNNIKAQMETIAEAGYSAIQTSPIQEAKEATAGVSNSNWWVFYQPKSFTIDNSGTSGLGTKAEFEAMCEEAHKYGIKVIVDIVANHVGNDGNGGIASTVISDIKSDSSCFHTYGTYNDIDYSNRYSITHDSMGNLPDLNTENTKIQNYVISLLKECIDCGADGFRFDAAKHISVPSEGSEYTFWPNVLDAATAYASSTRDIDLYYYGEVLDGTGGPAISQYTQYMSVTDNQTSNDIRNNVASGNASGAATSYYQKGTSAENLVLWAESHDTYQNDNKQSTYISDTDIKKTWALVASRADATALYYVRTNGWRQGTIGDICTWDWMSDEVAAVNKFHNYFNGETEYLSSSGSIAYNERGTSGVVLVNCSGTSTSVSVTANKMADGTYTDQITGNTFTVSGGIISGTIGSTGIAVVYNEKEVTEPTPTISEEGGNFSTDTLTLTLGLKNATSGTYKIGSKTAVTYTSSTSITIGSDMEYGDSVTITLTATDGTTTTTKSYTFEKVEKSENIVYYQNTNNWSSVYAYYWSKDNTTMTTWPGEKMTSLGDGVYSIEVPEGAASIIFNDGSSQQTDDLVIQIGKIYNNGTWKDYDPDYEFVPANEYGVYFENTAGWSEVYAYYWSDDNITMTTWPGVAMTEIESGIYGLELDADFAGKYIIFNNNSSQTDDLTFVMNGYYNNSGLVKVVEAKKDPVVISSLEKDSTFTTETQTITLTLENAVSGTYSVDNGPVKTFTSSAEVVLGQGKVADSVVTVTATATSSEGVTKTYTFTYNKKFNGTVNEVTNAVSAASEAAVLSETSSGQGLASYYSTNGTGVGVEKTITIDGNISDWDSSMIIARGTANDDPRVYRQNSMYEVPIDLYALYAAYDDDNLYLMWEMTNVQDIVAPNDTYPLSQGVLYQTQNVPFFLAIDTKDSETAIGNKGQLTTGGTIWDSGITISQEFNKLIAFSTNGSNGPFVYGGDSTGLNPVEISSFTNTGIGFDYGLGILSSSVIGINGGYGEYNNRYVGDMCSETSDWVDFNTLGHSTSTMDFHYEMSIPLSTLGITKSNITSDGISVLLIATFGKSGMDCLPYDLSMNDNADLDDAANSQENNSYEKSDADNITTAFANIGTSNTSDNNDDNDDGTTPTEELELNFGADRSSPQSSGTELSLKGIATGGTAPYTYEYYVNGTLAATKTGSGETSVSWTPSAGSYVIKCVVTDSDGTSVTSAKNYVIEGEEGKFNISFSNMSLGNDLAMNFAFKADHAEDWSGHYVTVTKTYKDGSADSVQTYYFDEGEWTSTTISGEAYYYVSFKGIAAKEMSDSVYVTVYNSEGENVSNTYADSIQKYAMRLLSKSTAEEEMALIVDMLNYGAQAQDYFKYNVDDLANAVLSDKQKAYASKDTEYEDTRDTGTTGYYYGTSLILESNIKMLMAFENVETTMYAVVTYTDHYGAEQEIQINGSDFTEEGSYCIVTIDSLVVADGGKNVTVTIYDASGTEITSVTDSIESYVARLTEEHALYSALMKFSDAAYNYFH